jgi:hypothetical protein
VSRTSGCALGRYRPSRTRKPAEAVSLLTLCSTSRLPRAGGQESAREAIPKNGGAHPSPSRGGSASRLCRSDWVARAPLQHTCTRVKPEPMLAGNSVRGDRYGLDMVVEDEECAGMSKRQARRATRRSRARPARHQVTSAILTLYRSRSAGAKRLLVVIIFRAARRRDWCLSARSSRQPRRGKRRRGSCLRRTPARP